MTLEIQKLHAIVDKKKVLQGVDLIIEPEKIHVLMGPNGAGKSTLMHALMGHPKIKITAGKIILDNEDISELSTDLRAKKGLFLSFQHPVAVPGVRLGHFLRTAYNSTHEKKLDVMEFKALLDEKREVLGLSQEFTRRYLHNGLSGGEKKLAEILQLLVLEPKFALLDETDSGLDVDAIKKVAASIKELHKSNSKMGIVIITHYKRFLEFLEPDKVSIIDNGKIVMEGDAKLAEDVEKHGFSKR